MLKIREIKEKDVAEIQKLALESWLYAYRKIYTREKIHKFVSHYYSNKSFKDVFQNIEEQNEEFIVALDKGRIIDYSNIGKIKNEWELLRIYVSPKMAGIGIGTILLKNNEKFLNFRNIKNYTAYPHSKNKIAVNFYLKSGFKREKSKDISKTSICFEKKLK